jgi:hypothetical protein
MGEEQIVWAARGLYALSNNSSQASQGGRGGGGQQPCQDGDIGGGRDG